MPKIDIVLDATMLDTFMSCAAKFDMRFNLNKTTVEKPYALDNGSMVHEGAEAYYKGLGKGLSYTERRIEMHKAVDYAYAFKDSDLEPSQITRVHEVLDENVAYWRSKDERMQIIAVEEAFSYLLHEDETIRLIMIGKIDMVVTDDRYTNVPYDHKSYERDSKFATLRKKNQFSNYANALQSNYLIVNRIGFQTSLTPQEKHKRVPIAYDPLYMEQWKANVIKWAYIYLDCAATNEWPLNDTSCDKFNRVCEYYDVCNASGETSKVHKLKMMSTTEPWDVSKSLAYKG